MLTHAAEFSVWKWVRLSFHGACPSLSPVSDWPQEADVAALWKGMAHQAESLTIPVGEWSSLQDAGRKQLQLILLTTDGVVGDPA